MKNFSFIVLTAIIAVAVAGCNPSEPQPNRSLVGTWCAQNNFALGNQMTLTADGHIYGLPSYLCAECGYTYTLNGDTIAVTLHNGSFEITEKFKFQLESDILTIYGFSNPFSGTEEMRTDVVFTICNDIQYENLCDYFNNLRDNSNGGNFGSELAPVVNAFLKTIDGSLSDEQKIEQVVIWLNSTNCGIAAETLCVSCIETYPGQSEIRIHYIADGVSKSVIMDISMSNPMRYGGLHCEPQQQAIYVQYVNTTQFQIDNIYSVIDGDTLQLGSVAPLGTIDYTPYQTFVVDGSPASPIISFVGKIDNMDFRFDSRSWCGTMWYNLPYGYYTYNIEINENVNCLCFNLIYQTNN